MAAPRKRGSTKVSKSKQPLTDLPVRDASSEEVVGGALTIDQSAGAMSATDATQGDTFSPDSDVMKTKHDTVKNSITNVR